MGCASNWLLLVMLLVPCVEAREVTVKSSGELRAAAGRTRPGDVILVAPGEYEGGVWLESVNGTEDEPISIRAEDPEDPPVFIGGEEAMHLSDCNHVTLDSLTVRGQSANGINCDDGGSFDTPSRGLTFLRLRFQEIGGRGNRDGLKLSGVDDFTVSGCSFRGWGGSAIDMVGCHEGRIERCRFDGLEGFSQDSGVQTKGGCESITIQRCTFVAAGKRAVNLGGSTGLQYFRPGVQGFEARAIVVEDSVFTGSAAPIAYVTSLDCQVRRNTIVHPEKWVMRILQEQPTDEFRPCSGGVFEDNLIVFDERVRVFVNIGPNTQPESFRFHGNAWFCTDGDRTPTLPASESGGIHQVDPQLEETDDGSLRITSKDERLRGVGARHDPGAMR